MIEQNLGIIERAIRLVLGIAAASWVIARPEMNVFEWVMAVIALFLVLNAISSRCYLWRYLNLNSRKPKADRAENSEVSRC